MSGISVRRRFVATLGLLVGTLLLTSTVSAVSASGAGSAAVGSGTASPVGGQEAGTGVHTVTHFDPSAVGHTTEVVPASAGAAVAHEVLRRSARSSTIETRGTVRVNDTTTPAAAFIVTYHDFSADQQAAFQAAIDNWSTHLFAPEPITVDASLAPLGDYILGGTDIPDQWHDLGGTMPSQLLYPQSLAKQLAPSDAAVQTSTSPDITITFSSSITPSSLGVNWYFGTDGHPPSNGVDFETVTMHELAHGLGFASSLDIGSEGGCTTWSAGCWGYGGGFGATLPTVYDANIFDCVTREWLTPTSPDLVRPGAVFTDNSTELAAELVSGHVCWGGPEGILVMGPASSDPPIYPGLYAPSDWEPGSSISHLNNPGSLLAYAVGAGVALHENPYDVDSVLTDLGWVTSPITAYYRDHGGVSGPFGARVQREYGTVRFTRFTVYANGAIVWSVAHGTHGFTGAIFGAFNALNGVIGMGDPTTEVIPSAGGHSRIEFTIGSIYSGPAGAFSLRHVSAHYEDLHADAGFLGMPLSSEASHGGHGTFAVFQGGRMYYTAALGAHEVHGAVLTEWGRLGGSSGALGYPKSDVRTALGVPTARFSQFNGGNIYWTASLGAHRVTGSILAYYLTRSSSAGRYGLPVGNPTRVDSVHVRQNFQHGNIVQNVTTGHVAGNLG